MTLGICLKQAREQLREAGIGTSGLDALVLLEHVVGSDRAWILAHAETEIEPPKLQAFKKLLNRRARHEPLAYLRGKTEFYGREFVLTPAVLEPRPESETMIEVFKALPVFRAATRDSGKLSKKPATIVRVADVGTGSGALGITAALETSKAVVELLDISAEAVKVAKMNVDKFTLSINVVKSNLLSSTSSAYDVLLCNLPYVPDDYQINQAAAHEPRLAIFGGPDGLDLYRRLFGQVSGLAKQPLYILTEAMPPQHQALERIANQSGYKLQLIDDFIQLFACIQKLP